MHTQENTWINFFVRDHSDYVEEWFLHWTGQQLGTLPSTVTTTQGGFSRVANNIAGYNIYVGVNGLPNLANPPTAFSLTLPITISTSSLGGYGFGPRGSRPSCGLRYSGAGPTVYYVLVRAQDVYGLESQNQWCFVLQADSSGNLLLPALLLPQGVAGFQQPSGYIRLLDNYPTALTDEYPATSWFIWAGTSPPSTLTTPTAIVPVNGQILATQIGPYSPGLTYVTVALYRAADNSQSPSVQISLTLLAAPSEVTPVLSGFQGT